MSRVSTVGKYNVPDQSLWGQIPSLLLTLSTTLAIYNRNPGSSGIFIIRDDSCLASAIRPLDATPTSVAATSPRANNDALHNNELPWVKVL